MIPESLSRQARSIFQLASIDSSVANYCTNSCVDRFLDAMGAAGWSGLCRECLRSDQSMT